MKRWRLLVALGCAQVCVICVLAVRTRAIRNENHELISQSIAAAAVPDSQSGLDLIEKENGRLKADLATIPFLSAKIEELNKESAEEAARTIAIWTERSNFIQNAIEQKRNEIKEIEEWAKDYDKMKMVERAGARLAQKASAKTKTPEEVADEYMQLEGNLKEIGLRMKKLTEARQEWRKTEKTPENREAFKTNMSAAWTELDAAIKKLGADLDLFEELPVTSSDVDFSKTPLYRSVIPDLRGITATLYLDGTVVWSPPLSASSAK